MNFSLLLLLSVLFLTGCDRTDNIKNLTGDSPFQPFSHTEPQQQFNTQVITQDQVKQINQNPYSKELELDEDTKIAQEIQDTELRKNWFLVD